MTVSELLQNENFNAATENIGLSNAFSHVYAGDLLSWVMANAKEGDAWVTIQGHLNVVAVALLTGVSCVIVAEGAEIEQTTLAKAADEGVPFLRTKLPAYEVCGLLSKALG